MSDPVPHSWTSSEPCGCCGTWRQARSCADDSLVDLWYPAALIPFLTWYFCDGVAGGCYYFTVVDAPSPTHGTLAVPTAVPDCSDASCCPTCADLAPGLAASYLVTPHTDDPIPDPMGTNCQLTSGLPLWDGVVYAANDGFCSYYDDPTGGCSHSTPDGHDIGVSIILNDCLRWFLTIGCCDGGGVWAGEKDGGLTPAGTYAPYPGFSGSKVVS